MSPGTLLWPACYPSTPREENHPLDFVASSLLCLYVPMYRTCVHAAGQARVQACRHACVHAHACACACMCVCVSMCARSTPRLASPPAESLEEVVANEVRRLLTGLRCDPAPLMVQEQATRPFARLQVTRVQLFPAPQRKNQNLPPPLFGP